jgi:hypothetical protein
MHHSGYSLFAVGSVPQVSNVLLNAQEFSSLAIKKVTLLNNIAFKYASKNKMEKAAIRKRL